MNRRLQLACIAAMLGAFTTAASAASVRITCEKRSDRSKISVDGTGLAPGNYYAEALSGSNSAQSTPERARRGEAQFDFDSNTADIAGGATAIRPDFIVDGKVTGTIRSASNGAEVASATATCRVRN